MTIAKTFYFYCIEKTRFGCPAWPGAPRVSFFEASEYEATNARRERLDLATIEATSVGAAPPDTGFRGMQCIETINVYMNSLR